MNIRDFKLECYFGKYEFTAPYLLTQSDCESMTTRELLSLEEGGEQAYLDQWLGYTETWGSPELREGIAGLYQKVNAEDVLVFHGAQEAIFAYMNVMLTAGDHLIAMYPNYQSAYEVAQSIPGCTWSKWMLHDTPTGWSIDFDELESLIQPNTKLITITSPNNPTGYTFTREEQKKLVAICEKHGLYLFADEVYKGLELSGDSRDWFADHYDRAVSLGVMSKAYGLAGIRVGWLATKDHSLLSRAVKFKHYTSICDAAPSEFLATFALRHSDFLLNRSKQIIRENLKIVDEFFDRYPTMFERKNMTCGPVAFHKLLLNEAVDQFCQRSVEEKGVLLLPAGIFEMEGPYFRMGYGRRNVPESLEQFEQFIQQQVKR